MENSRKDFLITAIAIDRVARSRFCGKQLKAKTTQIQKHSGLSVVNSRACSNKNAVGGHRLNTGVNQSISGCSTRQKPPTLLTVQRLENCSANFFTRDPRKEERPPFVLHGLPPPKKEASRGQP